MESLGAFPDGEWDSISRMFFTEEANFAMQYSFSTDHEGGFNFGTSSNFWSNDEANMNMAMIDESLFYTSDDINSSLFHFSQESSYSSHSSSSLLPALSQETNLSDSNYIPVTNNTSDSIDFCMMDERNVGSAVSVCPEGTVKEVACLQEEGDFDGAYPEVAVIIEKELQLKRKSQMPDFQSGAYDETNAAIYENPKKRSRVSKNIQRIKKNVQSKKNQKLPLNSNDEEGNNAGPNGQSSSCYSSEDDSNASQELNGGATSDSKGSGALNLNGKTRASRGSATDPQSLYARKRREKINERLRILQNLVPNGTKVDISTMLEEAVHYVKFLQLQIKLLSSDDHWMYAPIAYNGMDIFVNRTISPTL